jgi:hypothetical protein
VKDVTLRYITPISEIWVMTVLVGVEMWPS